MQEVSTSEDVSCCVEKMLIYFRKVTLFPHASSKENIYEIAERKLGQQLSNVLLKTGWGAMMFVEKMR